MQHTKLNSGLIIPCSRTFKAWLIELRAKARIVKNDMEINGNQKCLEKIESLFNMSLDDAKMFYNGGYSPKMVILEELRIPIEEDLIFS